VRAAGTERTPLATSKEQRAQIERMRWELDEHDELPLDGTIG
jgi:hypothetical protein